MQSKNMVRGMEFNQVDTLKESCFGCAAGKHHRAPFVRVEEKQQTEILGLIHSDLVGPLNPKTPQGKAYVLTFIDDRTRRSWVYLLASKDETLEKLKE